VIDPLLLIPHLQPLPLVRFGCRSCVDGDNNEEDHKLAVFPQVHGDDNEEEHISEVIDPHPPIQQPLSLIRFDCRSCVDGDNNEEGRKSEAIDR